MVLSILTRLFVASCCVTAPHSYERGEEGTVSFLIAVHVNEGMVLASDRRSTYTNTIVNGNETIVRMGVHSTDSTCKTFACPNGAGISTCGDASLLGKPLTGFIQEMIRTTILPETPVEEIPQSIISYFNDLEETPDTNFIVAGYSKDKVSQLLYRINVKEKTMELQDTSAQGGAVGWGDFYLD